MEHFAKTFIGGLIATISGHLIWVLTVINLVWLLIKDVQLFSWWWVIGAIVVFVVSIVMVFTNIFKKD